MILFWSVMRVLRLRTWGLMGRRVDTLWTHRAPVLLPCGVGGDVPAADLARFGSPRVVRVGAATLTIGNVQPRK